MDRVRSGKKAVAPGEVLLLLVQGVVVGVAFSLLEVQVPLTTICSVVGSSLRDRREGVCGVRALKQRISAYPCSERLVVQNGRGN